jgi:YkoY family integral membrane protein
LLTVFGQVLEARDAASVGALVVLEALLSGDNALVLAIMVKHLPKEQQKKALLYGLGGAFLFRLIAILFATIILKQWWLQAVGAAYLIFIAIKHLVGSVGEKEVKPLNRAFWPTVIAVEFTDIAFAVDSVLAGITFINNRSEKIWIVFFGAIVGIVLLRFAAGLFVRLLDRFPILDHVAYGLVAWVGVKLAFLSGNSWSKQSMAGTHVPEMPTWIFWTVLLGIAGIGSWWAIRNEDRNSPEHNEIADIIEDCQDLEIEEKTTS